MEYNQDDLKEFEAKQKEFLVKLTEIDKLDFITKKELVIRLIEVTRPLFDCNRIEGLKKCDLASYIHGKLTDYGINYPKNGNFYALFNEDEKREYGTKSISMSHLNHMHNFLENQSNPEIKKCECGEIQFLGLIYEQKPDKESIPSTKKDTWTISEKTDPYSNQYSEYLQRIKYNCDELGGICHDLILKFYHDEKIAKTIEDALTEKGISRFSNNLNEQKSIEAKLIHMGKMIDFRHKIGEFEKIKGIILEKTTYNVAKVAKLLNITPKHMSNNIKKNLDQYLDNLKWFRTIRLTCKHCKKDNYYELTDWYDEQLCRKDLDLEMRQLVLN